MNLKERNYAGDHVVVGGLTVLGDVKGGNITQMQRNVEQVQKQTEFALKTQERKWEELSADGVITPFEKQQLLKEIKNIQQSQSAIMYQARELGLAQTDLIQEYYLPKYNALYDYLYTTLKLFDDMESSTVIEDRTTFNSYFSEYYYAENFVLLGLTRDMIDIINIRVLDSLLEEGEEGDIGIYKGAIYQYVNGEWKNVSSGNYKGALNHLPADEQDAFFLASDDFTIQDNLFINGEMLIINNDELGIMNTYEKGTIYYCDEGAWFPEEDKTNYRYVAAFADVLYVTGDLPQIFQDALDELQEQIDDNADNITDLGHSLEDEVTARLGGWTIINGDLVQIGPKILEIIGDINNLETDVDSKIDHLPVYYGIIRAQDLPSLTNYAKQGDFFVYSGTTSGSFVYGEITVRRNGQWVHLDPALASNRNYYMQALEDILSLTELTSGYFSSLFAQSFWTYCGNMETLDVHTIYLRNTGCIRSAETSYSHESTGLLIDADGNIDANGDIHLGGVNKKVAIGVGLKNAQGQYYPDFNTYDCVIGGNTLINGVLKAVRFEIIGVQAGNVVQREYNNIFNDENTKKIFNLVTITRGTMRVKVTYNVTSCQEEGPYIYIKGEGEKFTQTGSGTLVRDISFTEYENIPIYISDMGIAMYGGGSISVSKIQLCLSADDSIFKAFTQFLLIDSQWGSSR